MLQHIQRRKKAILGNKALYKGFMIPVEEFQGTGKDQIGYGTIPLPREDVILSIATAVPDVGLSPAQQYSWKTPWAALVAAMVWLCFELRQGTRQLRTPCNIRSNIVDYDLWSTMPSITLQDLQYNARDNDP